MAKDDWNLNKLRDGQPDGLIGGNKANLRDWADRAKCWVHTGHGQLRSLL